MVLVFLSLCAASGILVQPSSGDRM